MRIIWKGLKWAILLGFLAASVTLPIEAAPKVQTVKILMGTPEREMAFVPDTVKLTSGVKARLIVTNKGKVTHDIHLPYLKDVESKVKVKGVIVEGMGIDGVHANPGEVFTWEFTPLKKGRSEIRCELPGHYEAGMRGTLIVQ